jgi:predicted ATPase
VLAARIDRLSPEEKHVLQSAAVIGENVPFRLIQAVVDMSEDELRRNLLRLQAAEFLYETTLFPEIEYTFKHGLTYQVAYSSILQERRRALHAQLVTAIELSYTDRATEQAERLAHHAFRGEIWDKAVAYLHQAGRKAAARSAYQEAISFFEQALEALERLPQTEQTLRTAVDIRIELGPALIATKGQASPEVGRAYSRARALCAALGESPLLFPVLVGFRSHLTVRAEYQSAYKLSEELLCLAQHCQTPSLLVEAHVSIGETLFWLGELVRARTHLERGVELYNSQMHGSGTFHYRRDTAVGCWRCLAWTLCLLGYSDWGLKVTREAIAMARKRDDPFSLAWSLEYAARIHQFRDEPLTCQEQAEAEIVLAKEQGFFYRRATGTILRGWAMAHQGRINEGMAEMRQGLSAAAATGAKGLKPYFLSLLADAHREAGDAEAGLTVIEEAMATARASCERFFEAEMHRLKGELLKQKAMETEAEDCFRNAIEVARSQSAKSLELRASMSLSRLWQRQGKQKEARKLLAEIYGWFTEGLDTADLKMAKALLEDLS